MIAVYCKHFQVETTRRVLLITENEDKTMLLVHKMKELYLNPGFGQRALANVQLQHVESLMGLLTILRAKWMIKNKQDPFNLIGEDYRKDFKGDDEEQGTRGVTEGEAMGALKDFKGLDEMLFKLYLFIMSRYYYHNLFVGTT